MSMGTGINDVSQECLVCGRLCENRRSLGNHVARSHKDVKDLKTYVLKYILGGIVPKCLCNCGEDVLWHKTKYSYNDYINGHNHTFSSTNQPIFTDDQVQKRNEKIKEVYLTRGDEIKEKISKSVSEGLKSSGIDFSEYFKTKWNDANFQKSQHIARVKSWSGIEGDDRRKKIFTPEFGRKISLANMNRPFKRISKEEEEFGAILDSIFEVSDVRRQVGVDLTTRTMLADFFIISKNAYIEFDGSYWHGLDRSEDYTLDQISNITNDLTKNKAVNQSKDMTYLRVSSLSEWRTIKSWDDLVSTSHHVVLSGHILKDGTFKLRDDQSLISRETTIRTNETELFPNERGRNFTESEVLPSVREFVRAYVEYWGWFYPPHDDRQISSVIDDLRSTVKPSLDCDRLSIDLCGSSWLKSRIRSFWHTDEGPVAATFDDKKFRSVLKYRLGLNNSKLYRYKLSNGEHVECKETFDISLKNIRTGLIVQRNNVSWFRPAVAVDVYKRYLSNVINPIVWDPSGGFGARMIAFAAVCRTGTYICCEPAKMIAHDLEMLGLDIKNSIQTFEYKVDVCGSESSSLSPNSVDFVFTSPPYFDKEQYFDEPGQCWKEYPTIDRWVKMYLVPTFKTAFLALRPNCLMVINIDEKNAEIICDVAQAIGFSLQETLRLPLGRDHFNRKQGYSESDRSEPVYVFNKS